ncbi:copper homeostasis protein CutC [Paenibacillus sp. NFR01]|uniref:copper homeostasis protein CutC n=1 Tax=Paenibacillus sp. NFR01 TaxID=1566279 RepID=UPI0008B29738|nr:copper homeostasis protein CutC [Paenibacillus sp. NFR01]SES90932.1 copper homeostasis protein [Paenibacillus sp. NFR01]
MLLEVIATTVQDAIVAEHYGADRIELITGIREGGLTPSLGLIEEVRAAVGIPVRVMIRPHARSFHYNDADVRTMLRDIRHIVSVGNLSLVMGMLTPDGAVDEELLKRLLDAAAGLTVTFHRAFDEVLDQFAALEALSRYPQITDILTSGGRPTAPEGAKRIAELERRTAAAASLSILAGSGLNADNLRDFIAQTAVNRVHFGSAVREQGDPLRPVDPVRLQAVRDILAF